MKKLYNQWFQSIEPLYPDIAKKIINANKNSAIKRFHLNLDKKYEKKEVFNLLCNTIATWQKDYSRLNKLTPTERNELVDQLHKQSKELKRTMEKLSIDVYLPELYGGHTDDGFDEYLRARSTNSGIDGMYVKASEILSVVDYMGQFVKDHYRPPLERKTKRITGVARSLLTVIFGLTQKPNYTTIVELVSIFAYEVEKGEVNNMISPHLKKMKSFLNSSEPFLIFDGIESKLDLFNFINRNGDIIDLTDLYKNNHSQNDGNINEMNFQSFGINIFRDE